VERGKNKARLGKTNTEANQKECFIVAGKIVQPFLQVGSERNGKFP
jgi:hypothetical protein